MAESAVVTQWIEIPGAGAGYLVLPPLHAVADGGAPARSGPGLLLWQEIFGINEHIRTIAAQYALDGLVVLVPDLFWRQAPRIELGYEGADRERAMALMRNYAADPADADADIAAALQALRKRPEVGSGARIGTIGWCFGGQMAYLTAAAGGVDAAVAYYGGGVQNRLDRAGQVARPLLMHYGGDDGHIPPEAVGQVRQALPQADIHVYPGAQHGFNCWARASWHPPSATLAHGRTLAFLAQHLHGA